MKRTEALAVQREALVARSATQRRAIIDGMQPLLRYAAPFDRVVGSVRSHPVIIGLAATAMALVGSRKIFDIATRLLTVYMLVRRR
jgi:hypothetical protein